MGKVYIGLTAVGWHKLWGGGRKAGCGVRCFGGMGERWKINGRRRGGCGPGMPGPYGGERKIVRAACPQAAAEGSRPLPTM